MLYVRIIFIILIFFIKGILKSLFWNDILFISEWVDKTKGLSIYTGNRVRFELTILLILTNNSSYYKNDFHIFNKNKIIIIIFDKGSIHIFLNIIHVIRYKKIVLINSTLFMDSITAEINILINIHVYKNKLS